MSGVTSIVIRFLLRMGRKRLERRIRERFDAALSQKIDAVVAAEDSLRARP